MRVFKDRSDPCRIFNRVIINEEGCWLYTRGIQSGGYGVVSVRNKSVPVHRLAYQLSCGPIPPRKWVLHRCDVRHCINPDHLFLGTPADNNRDCMEKGRTADRRGEKNTRAKLNTKTVSRIRRAYRTGKFSQRDLADVYDICQQQVSVIVRGEAWNGCRRTRPRREETHAG